MHIYQFTWTKLCAYYPSQSPGVVFCHFLIFSTSSSMTQTPPISKILPLQNLPAVPLTLLYIHGKTFPLTQCSLSPFLALEFFQEASLVLSCCPLLHLVDSLSVTNDCCHSLLLLPLPLPCLTK